MHDVLHASNNELAEDFVVTIRFCERKLKQRQKRPFFLQFCVNGLKSGYGVGVSHILDPGLHSSSQQGLTVEIIDPLFLFEKPNKTTPSVSFQQLGADDAVHATLASSLHVYSQDRQDDTLHVMRLHALLLADAPAAVQQTSPPGEENFHRQKVSFSFQCNNPPSPLNCDLPASQQ
jgi:hypothetical protein